MTIQEILNDVPERLCKCGHGEEVHFGGLSGLMCVYKCGCGKFRDTDVAFDEQPESNSS